MDLELSPELAPSGACLSCSPCKIRGLIHHGGLQALCNHSPLSSRGNRSGNWRRNGGHGGQVDRRGDGLGVGLLVRAVSRDVTRLVAGVASLAGGAERTSPGRLTFLGDVTELAARVALHSLRLAVAGKVIGPAALVTGGTGPASVEAAASEPTTEAPSAGMGPTGKSSARLLAFTL